MILRKLKNAQKTPVLNIPQVNKSESVQSDGIVIGCERLSHSQARMEQGAPLCLTHNCLRELLIGLESPSENNLPSVNIVYSFLFVYFLESGFTQSPPLRGCMYY